MALGKGPCSDTTRRINKNQCATAAPVHQVNQLPLQKRESQDLNSEAYLITWMEWMMRNKLRILAVKRTHEMGIVKTMKLREMFGMENREGILTMSKNSDFKKFHVQYVF